MSFDKAAAEKLLSGVFASWVQDLGLSVESISTEHAVLRMTFSDKLCRDNGVVCGQALMSLADTAMVFAVAAAAGDYLPMTTVDQTIHFAARSEADLLADARVVRLGRMMAYGSITITADGDARPVAMAQTAYALLRDGR